MNTFNLKTGETGAKLTVTFTGRTEGISDASAVYLRFAGVSRLMSIESVSDASYLFTTPDFALLNGAFDVPCDFKIVTPSGIFFWPKPGKDRILVEAPLLP
jgi:hypothetical protein